MATPWHLLLYLLAGTAGGLLALRTGIPAARWPGRCWGQGW